MFRKKSVGDSRRVGDLSLDELEAIVEERRRIERARAFAEADETRRFSAITIEPGKERRRKRPRRGWRDNILFLVEVAAVLGLIGIIIAAAGNLQALNEEVAQAIRGQQQANKNTQSITNIAAAPLQQVGELPGSSFAPST
ncbi:MAG TPA: hypothetical protein VFD70_03935, partial [Anaerolineae bacterium]|nr:hypothetical protein [Anaerolineae bacterium]